ncbi:hypothetical protein WJX73_004617 [Symbiochloris irregularis]|uniref:Vacuolar protein sorting-associated protein n=1 Tax=Symbiochloris irregularis TaxID=706552 RepID=A0AAW1P1Y0_9CHLO
MRRRPGLQGLQRGVETREHFRNLGDTVKETKLAHLQAQVASFKENLEKFALSHRDEIRKDPVFRAQFHTMCANTGVDPLASNKGMWVQLLGFGDFYYELGVQIVEACLATRGVNGGLMDLDALSLFVRRRRGSRAEEISTDDLLRAISKLKTLGGGWSVTKIGSRRLVRSVPGELSTDSNAVLSLAQDKGFTSEQIMQQALNWEAVRIHHTVEALLRDGLALIDDQDPSGACGTWHWVSS